MVFRGTTLRNRSQRLFQTRHLLHSGLDLDGCAVEVAADRLEASSELLGQETGVFETMSRAIDAEETGISFGSQHVARPLLTPDEVRTLREDLQLLFLAGQRPIVAAKLRYYADREFAGKFDKA